MMNHKKQLKPFERTLGNASLGHICAGECYGRLMMVECQWNDKKRIYMATYECAVCGKIVVTGHRKSGGRGNG